MALSLIFGNVDSRSGTGSQAVTGAGFTPKALIAWCNGRKASNNDTFGNTVQFCFGFSDGTNEFSTSIGLPDAVAGSTSRQAAKLLSMVNSAATLLFECNVTSFDSDGFTLNVTTAAAQYGIHYIALGGTDLTNVKVGSWAMRTTTGDDAVTGVGFVPTSALLMHGIAAAVPSNITTGNFFALGGMTASNQGSSGIFANTFFAANYAKIQRTNKAMVLPQSVAGTPLNQCSWKSFDSDGFTVNWDTVNGSASRIGYLALKGPSVTLGSDTQKTSTGTKATTGAGFTPKGVVLFGYNAVGSTGNSTTSYGMSVGATDGTNQGHHWHWGTQATGASDQRISNDKIITFTPSDSPAGVTAEATISSLDSDGFTLNWGTADATAREFIWAAFGDRISAPVTVTPGVVNLALTTFAPVVSRAVVPGVDALTLSAYAPTVTTPRLVTPGVDALTLSTFAPTVTVGKIATPAKLALALSEFAPTVSTPRLVTAAVGSLSLAEFAPTVSTPRLSTPGVKALTLSAFAPTVTVASAGSPVLATPGKLALALTTFAPLASRAVVPGLLQMAAIPYAPILSIAHTLTPGLVALSLSTFAPTVTATQNRLVRPGSGNGVLNTFLATVATPRLVTPGRVALVISAKVPTAAAPRLATPITKALSLTTFAPTVTATTAGVRPGVRLLALTAFAPIVTAPRLATPGLRALVLGLYAPVVARAVVPGTRALVLASFAPTVSLSRFQQGVWNPGEVRVFGHLSRPADIGVRPVRQNSPEE